MNMEWVREHPGVYSSTDDRFHLTFIPAHWEITDDGDLTEGEAPAVWDARTLSDAKASAERYAGD